MSDRSLNIMLLGLLGAIVAAYLVGLGIPFVIEGEIQPKNLRYAGLE